jgi:NAD(P)-dependent dehydrogenase (short-subunit alcohol dehydrogenase family)
MTQTLSTSPVAIVTGAGSGIGQAAAITLARLGYRVALIARTTSTLEHTASQCVGETMILPADVSKPESASHIVNAIMDKWGRIDVLLNIAGSAPNMPIEQTTPANWRACIDSNLSSTVLLTSQVWPIFQKQRSGFVGNVSSLASVDPFPGFAMYAAAKAGVNMFTHSAGQEGMPINVRVVAVAPGAVETPMLRSLFSESIVARDRTLTPQAVAQVLIDCLQGKRAFRNGETILLPSP